MSAATCQPVPGRLVTYRVVVAGDLTLGSISLDVSAQKWIARTLGNEKSAACLRRFPKKGDAIQWLQEREAAPAERGGAPYSPPGQRRSVR